MTGETEVALTEEFEMMSTAAARGGSAADDTDPLVPVVLELAEAVDLPDDLTPREAEILRLRFGLDRGEPRTLEEVGEHFNLTRERIRQIEARAMSKLRHPSSDTGARDLLTV